MVSQKMYCVKCKGKKMCSSIKLEKDRRGKPRMCGTCNACGIKCYQYVSAAKYISLSKSRSMKKSKSLKRKSLKRKSKSKSRRR
jgi:hypothetical protein